MFFAIRKWIIFGRDGWRSKQYRGYIVWDIHGMFFAIFFLGAGAGTSYLYITWVQTKTGLGVFLLL